MKFVSALFLVGFMTSSAVAEVVKPIGVEGLSQSLQEKLAEVEVLLESTYKVESLEGVEILYLEKWPVETQRSLYSVLTESPAPLLVDIEDLVNFQWGSEDGEYVIQGTIRRSVTVSAEGEKLYLAYYAVWGGEWGREQNFGRYFVLDSEGRFLKQADID